MFNFRSKIAVKILGYYFLNPSKRHYINELAKILEADAGNLFRKLRNLEHEGILSSEAIGNQRYFFLNKRYPLLKELKKAYEIESSQAVGSVAKEVEKDLAIINENMALLKKNYGVKKIGIFGSVAAGRQNKNSDVDVLVELSKPMGFFRFIELEDFLTKNLNRKVDLVSRRALKPVIKSQILKEVIYAQKTN